MKNAWKLFSKWAAVFAWMLVPFKPHTVALLTSVDGNLAYGKIAFATNGQFFVAAGFFLYAFTPGSPNPVHIYGNS